MTHTLNSPVTVLEVMMLQVAYYYSVHIHPTKYGRKSKSTHVELKLFQVRGALK